MSLEVSGYRSGSDYEEDDDNDEELIGKKHGKKRRISELPGSTAHLINNLKRET